MSVKRFGLFMASLPSLVFYVLVYRHAVPTMI